MKNFLSPGDSIVRIKMYFCAAILKRLQILLIFNFLITMTDPIADFLTRIRNAVKANHKVVEAPGSKMKQEITKILYEQGYILAYKFGTDEKGHPTIKIALKYHPATKTNAIKGLQRVSRPGLRCYANVANMPKVLNGLGIAILSTPKGIMTDKKARQENVGGEVLCYIY